MATWNVGPFDNDHAVEWCARLEATPADQRGALVKQSLARAVSEVADLSEGFATEAVSAAATVLQCLTGKRSDSAHAPHFLLDTHDVRVTDELRQLAVAAIDAVTRDGATWRGQWAGHVEEVEALQAVTELRRALSGIASERRHQVDLGIVDDFGDCST